MDNKVAYFFINKYFKTLIVKIGYWFDTSEFLDYSDCNTIDEKTHWLSAYYYNPLMSICADKLAVRDYLHRCGCGDILNTLFGSYNRVEEIDYQFLPDRFVLKANNGTGANFFCYDKSKYSEEEIKNKISVWTKTPYGIGPIEFHYYNIPFSIVCEEIIEDSAAELIECQLFCFNGRPESILVRNDLETKGHIPFAVTYSLEWKRLYYRIGEEQFTPELKKPVFLEKMIDYATRLSKPFPFVRIDFYWLGDKLFFGEMTFSSHGNIYSNYKSEIRSYWGDCLSLPSKRDLKNAFKN